MKLRSPRFEHDLRRQVRLELRRSPLLWKDYRQHRTGWWKRVRSYSAGFGALYIFLVVFSAASRSGRPVLLLTVLAIYALTTSLFRISTYYTRVLRGYDRAVLIALPVLDDDYLRHESRQLVRSWIGAFLLFLLAYGVCAAQYGALEKNIPAVLAAAILQTLTGLCFGIAILVYRPKWVAGSFILPLYGLIIACFFLPDEGLHFVWSSTLVTPVGWVAHGFAGLIGAVDSSQRFLLIPAFVVAAGLPFALRKLHSRFIAELDSPSRAFDVVYGSPSTVDEGADELQVDSGTEDHVPLTGPPTLQLGNNSESVDDGPIELRIMAWLSPRERVVFDHMLGGKPRNWSKNWRKAAYFTLAGALLTLAVPQLPSAIVFLPMVFAAGWAAPVLGGTWPGFQGRFISGVTIPVYACFPLAYGEITRVMLKTNLIRVLAWTPLAVVYASAVAWRQGYSVLYGAEIGLQIAILLAALQPFMIAGHFSSGTNDTRQFTLQSVSTIGIALSLLGVMLGAGITLFAADSLPIRAAALVAVFAASLVAWAAYRCFYERGRVDLLTQPKT